MARLLSCFKFTVWCLLLLSTLITTAQSSISNYKPYFATAKYNGAEIIILRKFEQGGKASYLYTNPATLITGTVIAKEIHAAQTSLAQLTALFKGAPYFRALAASEAQSFTLQDAGLIHGYPKEQGITLTIDLCPSHKPLDRIIFTSLISAFAKTETHVPVALSITGRFMLTHADDIQWLKNLEKQNKIDITWINHTYNHHYNPKAPLPDNFLLEPGTDVDFEILGTEIALLQHGLIPSVFFRFPGLVSDNAVVQKVTAYGLIPIGSDAWLAKGQQANSGSIVLIHGNGNEPVGVNDFIKLLQSEKEKVLNKEWLLYDLRESVENEFKQ
ncbi:polysaccharide deacetylase family protein [Flavobacterium psychrotrophum]|uniref:polysaccharide deacetylase family protein n=1 Tax=Flavobacterium psychrotrophum TaxID=2294119 RepID=UPI00196901DF|nr:polysaccharide deacetylase [Flavobacterium psychrotrophum]